MARYEFFGFYLFPLISIAGFWIFIDGSYTTYYEFSLNSFQARAMGVTLFIFSILELYNKLISIPRSLGGKQMIKKTIILFFILIFFMLGFYY